MEQSDSGENRVSPSDTELSVDDSANSGCGERPSVMIGAGFDLVETRLSGPSAVAGLCGAGSCWAVGGAVESKELELAGEVKS